MTFLEIIQWSKDASISRNQPQLLAWTHFVEKIVTVLIPNMNEEDKQGFLFYLEGDFSYEEEIYDAYQECKDYGENNFGQDNFYQKKREYLYNKIKNSYSHRFFNNLTQEDIDIAFNCNSMKSAQNR